MSKIFDEEKINIIGSGLSGLSAAITLSKEGVKSRLISLQSSERAQSNLAEGGINAALDLMGEDDRTEYHIKDTIKSGCDLEDIEAVSGLCNAAPDIVKSLFDMGVPFQREGKNMIQRSFGGQSKKRTAFVKSSTGRQIMAALIDEVRKYEAAGLVERYINHEFIEIIKGSVSNDTCLGARVFDLFKKEEINFFGPVIVCTGGLNGLFKGNTTGSEKNTGKAAESLFLSGAELKNLEMIQYHPTTIKIPGKRLLISEAARGEGGRLFIYKDEKKYFFMEEKFGERGNLMPRDIVSREIVRVKEEYKKDVYLDMTALSDAVWESRLSDLREEIIYYTGKDPKEEEIEVSPGIHYFMGGINVDKDHKTNIKGLFAAGECASIYHGANRLGGNSMLGAIYGGMVAGKSAVSFLIEEGGILKKLWEDSGKKDLEDDFLARESVKDALTEDKIREILENALSIKRSEKSLEHALKELSLLEECIDKEKGRIPLFYLSKAMVLSALERRESRGAHLRTDHKECDETPLNIIASFKDGRIFIKKKKA